MATLNIGLFLVLFLPGTAGFISCTGTYWDSWHWQRKYTTYYCAGTCCGTYYDQCCSSNTPILEVNFNYNHYAVVAGCVVGGVIVLLVIIGVGSYFLCKTTNRGSRSGTVHPSQTPNTQTTSFGPGIVQPPPYSITAPPPPQYHPPMSTTAPSNKLGHHPTPGPHPIQAHQVTEDAAAPFGSEPA